MNKFYNDKTIVAKLNWKEVYRTTKQEYLYLLKEPYQWIRWKS